MKPCSKCKVQKGFGEFSKDKSRKDGLKLWCRKCVSTASQEYRCNNKGKIAIRDKKYKSSHKESIKKYWQNYYPKNKEQISEYHRGWYLKNKDRALAHSKDFYLENREAITFKQKDYYSKHKKEKVTYVKERKKTNTQFLLSCQLRTRLNMALKGNQKAGSAVLDLGCTIPELRLHLEGQFQKGMDWNNHSREGWHIDHKIPLDFFDLTDREQFLKAVHYTNLQPLWKKDNIRKSNKINII